MLRRMQGSDHSQSTSAHASGEKTTRGVVVLVDERDRELGPMDKLAAHRGGGRLHRAFSVFLYDRDGRHLLQRRADGKYHFGGLWSNACCSHPGPGEDVVASAERRLYEELGLRGVRLQRVETFLYRAHDAATGLTEHELDHVLVGRFDGEPSPDPGEVGGWRWVDDTTLRRELDETPERFTPWFPIALDHTPGPAAIAGQARG